MRLFVILLMLSVSQVGWSKSRQKAGRDKKAGESAHSIESIEAPKDFEVCFSPDEPCDLKLARFVRDAQKSLDIAIYDITLDQLVHEILVKSKKIPVRIVVDQRQSKGQHSLVRLLVKAGANIRYGRQRGIMHNKFIVRDGAMIETGSFNYSNNAYKNNHENQVYLAHPQVVERFSKRFDEIWTKAKEIPKPGAPDKGSSTQDSEGNAAVGGAESAVQGK
jgi:phosphatidylserine/phosphatidylglycerophosphate/cardiolipin synthase-like enzyme